MQIKRVQQDRQSINIKKRKNNKCKINQQKVQSIRVKIKRIVWKNNYFKIEINWVLGQTIKLWLRKDK